MNPIVFFLALLFSLLGNIIVSLGQGFRGFPWGASRNEVIAKEGSPSDNLINSTAPYNLEYDNKTVAGNSCSTYFFFAEGKGLIHGYYVISFAADPPSSTSLPTDIIITLSKKYGKASQVVNKKNIREYQWTSKDSKITFSATSSIGWLHYYDLSDWLILKKNKEIKKTEGL